MPPTPVPPARTIGEYTHRVLIALGLAVVAVVLLLLIWAAADVLLLVFGGILLAVFLRGLAVLLSKYTSLPVFWSLLVVLLLLSLIAGLGGWLLGSSLVGQVDQLSARLTQTGQQLKTELQRYEWGRQLIAGLPDVSTLSSSQSFRRVTNLFSTTIGGLFSLIVILFTALYLAFDPDLYRRGMLRLMPISTRPRAEEVLDALTSTLRGWLISQAFSMIVVGIATTIGLMLLGIPLALVLGFIAFFLTFVPYIGPMVAAIPAVLVALSLGPEQAAYVAALCFGIQMVEGNLLTPLVQQQMVKLPPGLTIFSQVFMGVLLGTVGTVFATPLAACALVLVKMLYVESTLGDRDDRNKE